MSDEGAHGNSNNESLSATALGGAPAFNIVIGKDELRPLMWFSGAILTICLLFSVTSLLVVVWASTSLSAQAGAKVDDAVQQTEESNVSLRQDWYWEQMVYSKLEGTGIHVPPPPKPVYRHDLKQRSK